MGTRAAGGYVGMSEGWLGTVCALFLRSFNAATTLLKERKNNAHTLLALSYLQNLRLSLSRRNPTLGHQPLSALPNAAVADVPHSRISPQVISVIVRRLMAHRLRRDKSEGILRVLLH